MNKKGLAIILLSIIMIVCLALSACADEGSNSVDKSDSTSISNSQNEEGSNSQSNSETASNSDSKSNSAEQTASNSESESKIDSESNSNSVSNSASNSVSNSVSNSASNSVSSSASNAPSASSSKSNSASTADGKAPTYLGIDVSKEAPNSSTPSKVFALGNYEEVVSVDNAIEDYYKISANKLGETEPTAFECDLTAYAGETVYVQIWLNNPDQFTILSIMLNGTKYQSGGALRSYFYANGTNCIFVELVIPTTDKNEKVYEVTQIEYVDKNQISTNKEVLIDSNNDSVKIGLSLSSPNIVECLLDSTTYAVIVDLNITDVDNSLTVAGGWLRAVVYDGNNIVCQKKLTIGETKVTLDGLHSDNNYKLVIFTKMDLRQGSGVTYNILHEETFTTSPVIEIIEANATIEIEKIHLQAKLDESITLNKVELLDENKNADCSLEGTDLSAAISEHILTYIFENVKTDENYTIKFSFNETNGAGIFEEKVTTPKYSIPTATNSNVPYTQTTFLNHTMFGFRVNYDGEYLLNNYKIVLRVGKTIYINDDNGYPVENLENPVYTFETLGEDYFKSIDGNYYAVMRNYFDTIKGIDSVSTIVSIKADFKDGLGERLVNLSTFNPYFDQINDPSNTVTAEVVNNGITLNVSESAYGANYYDIYKVSVFDSEDKFVKDLSFTSTATAFSEDAWVNSYKNALKLNIVVPVASQDVMLSYLSIDLHDFVCDILNNYKWAVYDNVNYDTTEPVQTTGGTGTTGTQLGMENERAFLEKIGDISSANVSLILSKFRERVDFAKFDSIIDGCTTDAEKVAQLIAKAPDLDIAEVSEDVMILIVSSIESDHSLASTYNTMLESAESLKLIDFETIKEKYDADVLSKLKNAKISSPLEDDDTFESYQFNLSEANLVAGNYTVKVFSRQRGIAYSGTDCKEMQTCQITIKSKLATPENILITLGESIPKQRIITWDTVANAARYEIYVNDDNCHYCTENKTTYSYDELLSGDVVKVIAISEKDIYNNSEGATKTFSLTKLSTPTLTLDDAILGKVSWTAVDNATSYAYSIDGASAISATGLSVSGIRGKIKVKAVDSTASYADSAWSNELDVVMKLSAPTVWIDGAVARAAFYDDIDESYIIYYSINDGEAIAYPVPSGKENDAFVTLSNIGDSFKAKVTASGYEDSDWSSEVVYETALNAPTVTISGSNAVWTAVDNATSYVYKINKNTEQTTTSTSVELAFGDSIVVKALSTKKGYTESDFSTAVIRLQKISKPVVALNGNKASWSGEMLGTTLPIFEIQINSILVESRTTQTSYNRLNDGDVITVRQVSTNSKLYETSEWSEAKTYVYVETRTKLATPQLSSNSEGLTVVFSTLGSYQYTKNVSDGSYSECLITANDGDVVSMSFVELSDGETVYVRIVPFDNDTYLTSDWAEFTYHA